MPHSPSNNSDGATWLQREDSASLGGTWLTGGTWLRRMAAPALAVAMLAAPIAADTGDAASDAAPTTIDASGAHNEVITFSSAFAATNDVDLIDDDNLTYWAVRDLHNRGIRGAGIDIAVLDTGTALVEGLDAPGKVIYGPDLSAEGASENLANIDTYGHGTHLAGIAAGNDGTADGFVGIAPDARIVSLKLAGADGATSVAQAIAAIDWVVEHKNDNGLNIRVMNLSLGVQGVENNADDPLSAAVERAWDAGIVVVAAAGNEGNNSGGIDSPAVSPYVLAVGGSNTHYSNGGIPTWTSEGNGQRDPDFSVKGKSIVSLRVPGSTLDTAHPGARVGDRFLKGSGTSQAAALMSGNVALLLSYQPDLTPDEVKYLLTTSAQELDSSQTRLDGEGVVMIRNAVRAHSQATDAPIQNHPTALGITDWSGINSWTGGLWNGATWSGATWSGATWSGATWSGATWSGATWSGATWSGATWSGATWSGATWSGATWSGAVWGDDGWTVVGNATTEVPLGQSRAAAYDASDARLSAEEAAALLADRPAEGQDINTGFIAE